MTGSPVSLCGSSLWLLWLSCRTWAFEISLLVPEIEGVDRQIKYKILIFYFKKKISGFFSIIVNMIREIDLWWYWFQTIEWFFMGLTTQWRAYLLIKFVGTTSVQGHLACQELDCDLDGSSAFLSMGSNQSTEKNGVWMAIFCNLEPIFCLLDFHFWIVQLENWGETRQTSQ